MGEISIVYDNEIFLEQKYGGISRYYYNLINNLDFHDLDAKLICPYYINEYLDDLDDRKIFGSFTKINKKKFINKINNYIYLQKSIIKIKPDIIHETYFKNYSNIFSNSKIVITVHDLIHENIRSETYPYKTKTPRNYRKTFERADHFICVSNNTKKDLIKFHKINESKISVVYHGINIINSKTNFKNLYGNYILFVGWRGWYKNFENFIKALSILSKKIIDFNIVLFGGGELTSYEKDLITRNKLSLKNFHCCSGNDNYLSFIYKKAKMLIYPSKYEGFGFPPLEAMSNSCPVATSNTSSMPEICGEAAFYFDPNSPNEISKAIEEILFNSLLKERLIKNGIKRFKQFSWQKCASNTYDVYKKIL